MVSSVLSITSKLILSHKYRWIRPVDEIDGIRIASLEDIGGMKIHAIVQSGSRLKDFVDVHHLLENFSMSQLVSFYAEKYPQANRVLAENSLIYFDDIDFEIPVKLTSGELNWKQITTRFNRAYLDKHRVFESKVDQVKKKGRRL